MEGDTSKSQSKHEYSQISPESIAENAKGFEQFVNEVIKTTTEACDRKKSYLTTKLTELSSMHTVLENEHRLLNEKVVTDEQNVKETNELLLKQISEMEREVVCKNEKITRLEDENSKLKVKIQESESDVQEAESESSQENAGSDVQSQLDWAKDYAQLLNFNIELEKSKLVMLEKQQNELQLLVTNAGFRAKSIEELKLAEKKLSISRSTIPQLKQDQSQADQQLLNALIKQIDSHSKSIHDLQEGIATAMLIHEDQTRELNTKLDEYKCNPETRLNSSRVFFTTSIDPLLPLLRTSGSSAKHMFGDVPESSRMEEGDSRRWEDLDPNILAKIFRDFDIFELTSGIAHTCSSWRNAACDPLLWKTLDLSMLKSNFIKIPLEPYVYVDGRSDRHLTRVLKLSLNLSRGSITTLLFHHYMYVSDAQLTYTAERTPKLKRLVLPAWNRIKRTGICKAISLWNDLESLTMPSIANPPYLMEAISQHCKNFSELKILGPCDMLFVQTLIRCVPNLKVLSIRCSILNIEALLLILNDLKNLEVLNISHCFIVEVPPPPATRRVIEKLDSTIMEKGKRLREFYTCLDDSCIMCQRSKADEGLMRWYKYDGLWKEDEVKSLAV